MPAFGYPALTRADATIAMRNAHADAAKRRAAFAHVPGFRLEPGVWAMMLREAFFEIRRAKSREQILAHSAAVAEENRRRRVAGLTRLNWEGPQDLLDARDVAELEVLRFEMADSFTATGNSRLFEAKARLAEIEAQLTWRTLA